MDRCRAIKANGERCGGRAIPGSEWCWNHDPTHAEARRRNASKGGKRGGRGRPPEETKAVKKLMDDLTERALGGDLPPPVVHAVVALQNIKLRALEQERKVVELEDVLARLDALEERQRQNQPTTKGARRW